MAAAESPAADTYVRYNDPATRSWKFVHLLEKYQPLRYPIRIESLAPGAISTNTTALDELNPSKDKKHVFHLYLGCYPGFFYELWLPTDQRQGSFDERVDAIDENLTRVVTYSESPYDAPAVGLWVIRDRYPAIRIRNVGRITAVAKVRFTGAKYRVEHDEDIAVDIKDKLTRGDLPSLPISVGGEW